MKERVKTMTINEFAAEVHKNAVEHGWWEGERTFPEIVALIHSEEIGRASCRERV